MSSFSIIAAHGLNRSCISFRETLTLTLEDNLPTSYLSITVNFFSKTNFHIFVPWKLTTSPHPA